MTTRPLTITRFQAVNDAVGARQTLAWGDVVAMLERPPTGPQKAALPLFSPVEFDGRRTTASARRAFMVVGEHDAGTVSVDEALRRVRAADLRALIYTSPSYTEAVPKWRIVCPLTGPVAAADYPALADLLNGVLGGCMPPEAWDVARQWYFGRVSDAAYRCEVVDEPGSWALDELRIFRDDIVPVPRAGRAPAAEQAPLSEDRAEVLAQVTPQTLADLRSALTVLDADDRGTWIDVGQALRCLDEDGRALWIEWSQRSQKWQDADAEKWDGFGGDRSDFRAVFTRAQRAGWVNPGSGAKVSTGDAFPVVEGEAPVSTKVTVSARTKRVEASTANVNAILRMSDRCGYRFRYDGFHGNAIVAVHGSDIWVPLNRELLTRIKERLERGATGFNILSRGELSESIHAVAKESLSDVAIAWADALPAWDGVHRIDRFLIDYAGAQDTPYARAVGAYLWTALAGRVLVPGIKADMVPVLVGPQGARKTTLVQALAPDPLWTITLDLGQKDAETARRMRGRVVCELSELKGLAGRAAESIKSFVTETVDQIRAHYSNFPEPHPRRCVFIGTSNRSDFLADDTGNRRWLPIEVGQCRPDLVERDRSQLWAEGIARFRESGIAWDDAQRLAVDEHEKFEAHDTWAETIAGWLDEPVSGLKPEFLNRHRLLRVTEVATEALGLDVNGRLGGAGNRIAGILRHLGGVEQRRTSGGSKVRVWTFPKVTP